MPKLTLKQQLQDKELQREIPMKVVRLNTDVQLYEKLLHKRPNKSGSGDMRLPGYNGLWGEYIQSEHKWTEGRFFVSKMRGYPQTGRMSLAKAWLIRCLRIGTLK